MGNSSAREARNKPQFLDLYDVGEQLGEGSFGVVYACSPKGSSKECAVKMVDKVETPVAKIMAEAEMLSRMKHPNVINCCDVIFEKCFVCIVMDRLRGGDLIRGMQAHWKEKGRIPFNVTGGITYQMASAVDYLHGRSIIHRDVKADNYLCDRQDITDDKLRVILTDFGTALDISPGQRLTEKAGTKLYWSPEFYTLHYSLPVDVWAVGVVVYGLLLGRFPFKNEADVKKKPLKLDSTVPDNFTKLVTQMLDKEENKRVTASAVVQIPWLKKMKKDDPAAAGNVDDVGAGDTPGVIEDFREIGAKIGVKERREELVERMVDNARNKDNRSSKQWSWKDSIGSTPTHARDPSDENNKMHFYGDFNIKDRSKKAVMSYEWWAADKVDATIAPDKVDSKGKLNHQDSRMILRDNSEKEEQGSSENEPSTGSADSGPAKPVVGSDGKIEVRSGSLEMITGMLQEHNISIDSFGKGQAKTLQQLATEIRSGAAMLMLDAADYKKLVRVVDVVCLRICPHSANNEFLVETEEIFADGRKRTTNRLPGTKKEPHENSRQTAQRIMQELIDLKDVQVAFDYLNTQAFELEEMSPSYPGVCTVYRKEIIQGYFTEKSRSGSSASWSHKDSTGNTKVFEWLGEEECIHRGVEYKPPNDAHDCSALVPVPVGFDAEALEEYLTTHQVEISKFGQDRAKTLDEFAAELQKGEAFLVRDTDGSVVRVVDVVLIRLISENKQKVLVQSKQKWPDGTTNTMNRLPGMKGRPDQNHFITAKKILARHLHIPENYVNFSVDVKVLEQEQLSVAYPGVRTVYEKRIITAHLQSYASEDAAARKSLKIRLNTLKEDESCLSKLCTCVCRCLQACLCPKREDDARTAKVPARGGGECEMQSFNDPSARV